jgi:hypothetical protein
VFIEQEVVVERARSARAETEPTRVASSGFTGGDAHAELSQLNRVAAIKREADHGSAVDDLPGFRRVGFQQRSGSLHLNFFAQLTHLQSHVGALALLHIEGERPNNCLLEARSRNRQSVRVPMRTGLMLHAPESSLRA